MEKENHININCEVHLPSNETWEMLNKIESLNSGLPDEMKIVSVKTKGGVIVKLEDINKAFDMG